MLIILLAVGMAFFAIVAIYFSIREASLKKMLAHQEAQSAKKVYEISVLKTIQDRIGYSLDVERVIDTLTGSLKNLFPYSTVSSIILHEDTMLFKIALEERVSNSFVEHVKMNMLASLTGLLDKPLPQHVEEVRTGLLSDEANTGTLSSFFHVPLIVNGNIEGLMSICSTKPGLYKDDDMTIFYQLAYQASGALSKLQEVITTEQEKLLAMITSLIDGILMIDNTYKLTLINASAKDLLDIPHLTNPTIFDIVNMLSKESDFGINIKKALSDGKAIQIKELHLAERTVHVVITPILGPAEDHAHPTKRAVKGVSVLLHDITLERSLAQMKEDFTNEVVHELRSPLTAIKAASEMMIPDESLGESQRKLAVIIEEQSKRLLGDINSLLDVAKMESGNFTIWQKPSDMAKIIQDTIHLFQPEAEKKQIALSSSIDESLPQAFIDTERMREVLNNLVSNSLKFTPPHGHVEIKCVSQFNSQLPHTSTNPGLLISVTDDGIGIPVDKQKRLFTKFTQVHGDKTTEPQEGTGLGLYISKGIVEAHTGNMYINSTQGKGTTIFFTLPIAQEEKKSLLNPKLQEMLEQYGPKGMN